MEKFSGLLLLAIAALAPLPFGADHVLAWGPMAMITAIILAIFVVEAVMQGRAGLSLGRFWLSAVLFGGALAWAMVQTVPILPDLAHPVWEQASAALGAPVASTISVSPLDSRLGVARLAFYAGFLFLVTWCATREEFAELAVKTIAISTAVYALYGLAIFFNGNHWVLWEEKTGDSLSATLFNRNTYAAYAGLGVLVTTALLMRELRRIMSGALSWVDLVKGLVEDLLARRILLLIAWQLNIVALLLSHSRGGLLATLVGILVLTTVLAMRSRAERRMALRFGGSLAIAGFGFLLLSGERTMERVVERSVETDQRWEIFAVTEAAIADRPWVGTGLETFAEVFSMYRPIDLPAHDYAHNAYLELALELGLPAALCLLTAIVILTMRCALAVRKRKNGATYPALAFSAVSLAAVHSLFDSPLFVPGVAIPFLAVLGVGLAQSFRRGTDLSAPMPWLQARSAFARDEWPAGGAGSEPSV